ncbi:MAG: DUF3108 domain-containing protein [Xanthomonadaceae bacterium]|jgi:hypothetical protein|nr:DUF3108 domain-containing protein [Xanthomonadaceae bacterium]
MTAYKPRILGSLIALTLPTVSLQALAMEPFTADYQANYMGMQASGTMSLTRQDDSRWVYSLNIKNRLASLAQSTTFDVHNGRLRPLNSIDNTVLLVKKKNVQGTYDWNSRQATWSGDIKPERRGPVELQPGDLDGLLINLAIVRDLAAGKPLNYRMVDNGRARPLTYQIAGKETITVEGRSYEATKVHRNSGDKEQIAWIVSTLPVPIRILQREDGKDTIDLTIKSLR